MGIERLTRRDFIQKATGAAGASLATGVMLPGAQQLMAQSPAIADSKAAANSAAWFVRNDPSWVNKLSHRQYEIQFEFDAKKIPMRDGVMLAANIWRPKAEGKFPVIYMHTPYDKSHPFCVERAKFYVPRGYVLVAVDVRGRYDSDGVHYLFGHTGGGFQGQDVYDCVRWMGKQPWSSGKVGMVGPSVLAFNQWLGAYLNPPHLTTIVPCVSLGDWYEHMYDGGAFHLATALHHIAVLGRSRTDNDNLEGHFYDWNQQGSLYRHLPLRNLDEIMLGRSEQLWQDYIDHPDNDEYWRLSVGHIPGPGEMSPGKYGQVQVPSLNITGWYDTCHQGTMTNYLGMMKYGPERLRDKHHLIVGPWEHAIGVRKVGDLDFGPEANAESLPQDLRFAGYFLKAVELRWLDYWLRGIENGIMDEAPVHLFTMGENVWRSEKSWPLSRAKQMKFYLRSSGHANTRHGDGALSAEHPADEPFDHFVYDPEDPVLTHGGPLSTFTGNGENSDGPRDQRSIQNRKDVLVYTSEPMRENLEIAGEIMCKLYAASSAVDTDFTAKLLDVHPDGYAQILVEGVVRARYRNSYEKQELITPGKIYEYTLDLWSLSHAFRKGHSIQVEISSSNFPMYDRNPNTGHKFGEDAELRKATQTIYHDAGHASHVILPVV